MSRGLLVCKDNSIGQRIEKKEEVDMIGRGGKTLLKNGQGCTLQAKLWQLKTGQDGKGLGRGHLWCPIKPCKIMGYTRLDFLAHQIRIPRLSPVPTNLFLHTG